MPTTPDSPTHLLKNPAIKPPETRPNVAAVNVNVTLRISSYSFEAVALRTNCGIMDII